MTKEEFSQVLHALLVQYTNGEISWTEYKAAIDDLDAQRPE